MFLVFNKSKIYSYMIALSTVLILFVAVATFENIVSPTNNIVETSVNSVESEMKDIKKIQANEVNANHANVIVGE